MSKSAFPLLLDVTDYATIPEAVRKGEQEAGPIDVLVNNAGYGHEGVLEEASRFRNRAIRCSFSEKLG